MQLPVCLFVCLFVAVVILFVLLFVAVRVVNVRVGGADVLYVLLYSVFGCCGDKKG